MKESDVNHQRLEMLRSPGRFDGCPARAEGLDIRAIAPGVPVNDCRPPGAIGGAKLPGYMWMARRPTASAASFTASERVGCA